MGEYGTTFLDVLSAALDSDVLSMLVRAFRSTEFCLQTLNISNFTVGVRISLQFNSNSDGHGVIGK